MQGGVCVHKLVAAEEGGPGGWGRGGLMQGGRCVRIGSGRGGEGQVGGWGRTDAGEQVCANR